jgi:hypothetical protein
MSRFGALKKMFDNFRKQTNERLASLEKQVFEKPKTPEPVMVRQPEPKVESTYTPTTHYGCTLTTPKGFKNVWGLNPKTDSPT